MICADDLSQFSLTDDEIKRYQHIGRSIRPRLIARIIGLLVQVRKGLVVNVDMQALLEAWIINATVQTSKYQKTDATNVTTPNR